MVKHVCDPAGRDCHWLIRPNQSLSWQSAVKVYIVIAAVCLAVGIFFALHGFWPVLPFAGLEVAVLGFAFFTCLSRSQQREIVTVDAERVSVEKGRRKPHEHWECPLVWARVDLERPRHAWYPSRLSVAFQGRRVEIGAFLNEQERCALAGELQDVIRNNRQRHA